MIGWESGKYYDFRWLYPKIILWMYDCLFKLLCDYRWRIRFQYNIRLRIINSGLSPGRFFSGFSDLVRKCAWNSKLWTASRICLIFSRGRRDWTCPYFGFGCAIMTSFTSRGLSHYFIFKLFMQIIIHRESSLSFSYARIDSSWKTSFCLVLDVKLRHLRFKIKYSTITFCICLLVGSISVARLPVCKLKVEAQRRTVISTVAGSVLWAQKQPQ